MLKNLIIKRLKRLIERYRKNKALYLLRKISKKLNKKIVYFDIGSRYGVGGLLEKLVLENLIQVVGFEPDAEECRRLNKNQKNIYYHPFALGSENTTKEFFVTKHPGASSFLKPNKNLLEKYPIRVCFEIEKAIPIETKSLKTLIEVEKVSPPHFLKLDTQGFEMEILKGGEDLSGIYGIQLETHLEPIYENQSLFPEIKRHLEGLGFSLVGLYPAGPFEGEVIELEAFFFRNELSLENKLMKKFFEIISGTNFLLTLAEAQMSGQPWDSYLRDIDPMEYEILKEIKSLQE